jgi:hypothetical protein
VKWQRDGSDWSTSQSTSVTMNADHTLTAVYGGGPIGVPASFNAYYEPSTGILWTGWAVVNAADDYEVELYYNGAFQSIYSMRQTFGYPTTGIGFSFGGASLCVRFRVRAVDSAQNRSAWSGADIATTFVFADDPVVAKSTTVREVHITQLRTAIDLVRSAGGLGSYGYSTLTSRVLVSDITELRTALSLALSALSMPTPSFADPTLSHGMVIRAVHVQQLRDATK